MKNAIRIVLLTMFWISGFSQEKGKDSEVGKNESGEGVEKGEKDSGKGNKEAKVGSSDLTLVFTGDGKFERIDGKYDNCDGNKNVKIKIIPNKDFLKKQFRELFDKYITAYNGYDSQTLKDIYDYTESQKQNEFLSLAYIINRICYFYQDIKQIVPEFDRTTIDTVKFKDYFKDLYTLKYTYEDNEKELSITPGSEVSILNNYECGKKFTYELRFNKPMSLIVSKSIASIYNTLPSKNKFIEVSKFVEKDEALKKEVITLNKILKQYDSLKDPTQKESKCKEFNTKMKEISTTPTFTILQAYFKSNQQWVVSWLWYTEGVPNLDPFGLSGVGNTTAQKKELALQNKMLSIYQKKKKYYDTVLVRFPLRAGTIDEKIIFKFADTLNAIQEKISTVESRINELNDEIKTISSRAAEKSVALEKDKIKDIWLYSGNLVTNKTTNLDQANFQRKTYLRYHDANKNYEIINNIRDNYDEDSHVTIVIENETVPVTLTNKYKAFKDSSIVSAIFNPLFDQLISFTNQVKSTGPKNLPCQLDQGNLKKINYYFKNLAFFNSFELFQTTSDSSLRRTRIFNQTKGDTVLSTSYSKTYIITEGNKKKAFTYRVNRLYRFWPSVGIVNSNAKRPEVTIQSDNSLKSEYFDGLKLITGVKIYPWKTAIMDAGFIGSCKRTPGFDYRKIYLFSGVNALSPAKEFFLGGGLDLWSGISITGGWHLISKKQQKYVNSTIETKHYIDGKNGFIGINIDVTLALKAIQFFTKQPFLR
jgi:hypothetical protein